MVCKVKIYLFLYDKYPLFFILLHFGHKHNKKRFLLWNQIILPGISGTNNFRIMARRIALMWSLI